MRGKDQAAQWLTLKVKKQLPSHPLTKHTTNKKQQQAKHENKRTNNNNCRATVPWLCAVCVCDFPSHGTVTQSFSVASSNDIQFTPPALWSTTRSLLVVRPSSKMKAAIPITSYRNPDLLAGYRPDTPPKDGRHAKTTQPRLRKKQRAKPPKQP